MNPIFRPTWRPFATSSSSPWRPMWTTSRPFYDRTEQTVNYHDGYGDAYRKNRYQDSGPYRPEWKPSNGNLGQSSDSNYEFQDSDRQWPENQRTDQNAQRTYHFIHPEGSSYEHGNQDHRDDHRHYPPGYHYHHHHHHYHNYGSNPRVNPSWNSGSTATTGDRRYDQDYTPNAGDSQSHHDHHFGHYDHHYAEQHTASSETDQRQFQPFFPSGGYNEDNIHNEYNETKSFGVTQDNLPVTQRINHDLSPNRQDYSRTNRKFYHHSFNHTSSPAGNVLLKSGNEFAEDWNRNKSQGRLSPSWAGQENIAWNQPNGSSSFKPSTWNDQQNRQIQPEIQMRPWNQGK